MELIIPPMSLYPNLKGVLRDAESVETEEFWFQGIPASD